MRARHVRGEPDASCELCHHRCSLSPGRTGRCGIRLGSNEGVQLPHFGHVSAFHVDPIEKKPLYHFAPGSRVASVGFFGCNLSCAFCQNYQISQRTPPRAEIVPPEELVSLAAEDQSIGLAFTYNEPTVHFEYLIEVTRLLADSHLASILVTNGSLRAKPAAELLALTDAANVDLKAFTNEHYRSLGGDLATTCNFIQSAAQSSHVEVTTLVVPGFNDSPDEVRELVRFVASVSPDIPFHISAYRPAYRSSTAPTSHESLERVREIALDQLRYVYVGNTRDSNVTSCGACGAVLVSRSGYRVDASGFRDGACAACGARAPVVQWPVDTSH